MEHIGIIEEAGQRATKKGGTAFHMQLKDPKWGYYLFDAAHKEIAEKNIGKKIKVTYTENEKGRNVSAIEAVAEQSAKNAHCSPASDAMSKADWERKDRMIHRDSLAKAIIGACHDWTPEIEAMADRTFAWVVEAPAPKPAKAVAAPTAQQGGNVVGKGNTIAPFDEEARKEEEAWKEFDKLAQDLSIGQVALDHLMPPVRTRGDRLNEINNILKAKGYSPVDHKIFVKPFGVEAVGQLKDEHLDAALEAAKALKAKGG